MNPWEKMERLRRGLASAYLTIKERLVQTQFVEEIDWQDSVRLEDVTESGFLCDAAFVILNSGMRAAVVRDKWPNFRAAFCGFPSAEFLIRNEDNLTEKALMVFGHRGKVRAIFGIAQHIGEMGGWEAFWKRASHPDLWEGELESLPFIGPITKYHLAKNLGFDCCKPDRHLERLATAVFVDSPYSMCRAIQDVTGDKLSVIDIVLWRHCEQNGIGGVSEWVRLVREGEDRE